MSLEDQLLNVSPPRPLPERKARVLETGVGRCPPAKSCLTEEAFKAKHTKCPCGGVRAMGTGCDPTVDNGCAESEPSPAEGPVSGSSECACLIMLRSLRRFDEEALDADEVVVSGDDDGASIATAAGAQNTAPGSSTPSDQTTEEMADDVLSAGYETPSESVFNPFAPGPEELGEFAPMILPRGSRARRIPLRRQLQFDSCDSSSSSGNDDDDDTAKGTQSEGGCTDMDEEEKRLLGSLYATHYNFILSTLLEEQSSPARESSSQSEDDESPRTPSAVPFLTGVADTCPGAPIRHVSKARKLDPAICRKLDFS